MSRAGLISGDNEKTNGILKDNCGFYGLESTTDLLEIDLGILLCGEPHCRVRRCQSQ